ncbi:MAG: CDP-diacylglycerol--serine O-phosphatidyltransferase [Epsilonproteobacteria bacterium]|nr:CDP-diacylglycerol--serine O-phosphatidyltransferase [Campylobacterota bacterium]
MKTKPSQYIYILPNLFTAASIFFGVLSMVSTINADFTKAAWLILLSLIFDGLDGRVARLTNSCSKFGMEFDSLADIVAFGVAPALLLYLYVGHEFGRFGIVVSALFVIFGAIRLARFNVMSSSAEPSVFIGVPIPTAAVFIALQILLFQKYNLKVSFDVALLVMALAVSMLMVSNIRYPSFKKIDTSPKNVRKLFIMILVIGVTLFVFPTEGCVTLFTLYLLYGPLRAVMLFFKKIS